MTVHDWTTDSVPSDEQPIPLCPACGQRVPEESVWNFNDRLYCSESCGRRGAGCQ